MPDITVEDKRDRTPPKEYGPAEALLDRIIIRRVPGDPGMFKMDEKYRESQNWGTVIAIGDSIVLGGTRFPLSDFVSIGDLIKYGESTAEIFDTNEPDVFVVRIQDCRARRRAK